MADEGQVEVNHGPQPVYPHDKTIVDLLEHNAAATPQAVALVLTEGEFVDGNRLEVTYSEMWSFVNRIATALIQKGAGTGTKWVMVVLPEGLQQVCSVWGILRAGCGYVPIDASTEAPRLRMLFEETQPSAVIGDVGATPLAEVAVEFGIPSFSFPNGTAEGLIMSGTAKSAVASGDSIELAMPAPEDLALLLFSSGSTGVPKGIMYDHKWLMGGSYFVAKDLELGPGSHCLQRCSYVWSVSLYDLFPATMMGGVLFIPPPGGHKNVQYMAETIEKETIHAVVIQPTLLNILLDEHKNSATYPLRSLRHVVSSGEKLFTSTADAFVRTPGLHAKLWNMYGATEAGCTFFVCCKGDEEALRAYPTGVPAGIPQAYVDVWIMEESSDDLLNPLKPVPTGKVGEICFGGGGQGFLARGYWKRDGLTAEKFVETGNHGLLYRTGDAGYWEGGVVLVSGRLDRQVKVRGVRIQPEGIEACLKRYIDSKGDMQLKAVLVVPSGTEPIELTAFIETLGEQVVDMAAVRAFLRQVLLPHYYY